MKNHFLNPLEDNECYAFADYLRIRHILFSHVNNENTIKSKAYCAKMKRKGVNKGVPDYIILPLINGIRYHVYIEMKRKKGSDTKDDQKEWRDTINEVGGNTSAHICDGATQAIKVIEDLYAMAKRSKI